MTITYQLLPANVPSLNDTESLPSLEEYFLYKLNMTYNNKINFSGEFQQWFA